MMNAIQFYTSKLNFTNTEFGKQEISKNIFIERKLPPTQFSSICLWYIREEIFGAFQIV